MLASLQSPWVPHRLTSAMQRENGADIGVLLDDLASGRLRAPVDAVLPLEDAPEALRRMAERAVAGKLVLTL
ncbi:zinc-binding dehydrogenase [Chryseoglobus sp. 28M-23]|uniref:zinc-binding dehydrogenase n=1 Tax=Chryseoglobus sp. 28M-23 TaxID=2772253 RepID=UPI001CD04E31|nr:zinc-binding dehydrogenase [Chryseoglobus sp. 28M-23]